VTDAQVIVVGGGISGCLAACLLADAGVRVVIIDRGDALMDGASRWNDGKIHLGYTFTGVASPATAALMQEGAATFLPTLEQVLGGTLPATTFGNAVTYLVDAASMLPPETLWQRAQAIAAMLRSAPGASAKSPLLERIAPDRAMRDTGQANVAAAWRTTEIHVAPGPVADAIVGAVAARAIPVLTGTVKRVDAVRAGWRVSLEDGRTLAARSVVNAAWEGRTAIDRTVAAVTDPVSIRYKVGLFGTGVRSLRDMAPSTRILGRFGDIVTYAEGEAYLSWYPVSLLARSDDGMPPALPSLDEADMMRRTLAGLGLPPSTLTDPGASWRVRGGYVVAHGYGDIDHLGSPLHERDHPRVSELRPGYVTVDTGKYTLGPLMARRASDIVRRHLRARRDAA